MMYVCMNIRMMYVCMNIRMMYCMYEHTYDVCMYGMYVCVCVCFCVYLGVYLINPRQLVLALPKGRPVDVGLQTDIGHGQARAPVEAGGYFLHLVSILKNFFSILPGNVDRIHNTSFSL